MKRRFAAALFALVLCLFAGLGEAKAERVEYVDENGDTQTAEGVTVVTNSMAQWNGGWYVVQDDVTVGDRIAVKGDVKLILADAGTLKAEKGIAVTQGNAFTIYGQEKSSGELIATGVEGAGIGANSWPIGTSNGAITINGGNVTAIGGTNAAGIGSSSEGNGSNITINGGTVTATGNENAAGIGGGYGGSASDITITGGNVEARGGYKAAGIGGGDQGKGTDITITGGSGGGSNDITISGGAVTASGGGSGAGIGGGMRGDGHDIRITGGTVTATGGQKDAYGDGGAGIGGGAGNDAAGITISGGTVTAWSWGGKRHAIGAVPLFMGYNHMTFGNAEKSTATTDVVEWTDMPSGEWDWLWVKIQELDRIELGLEPWTTTVALNGTEDGQVEFTVASLLFIATSGEEGERTDVTTADKWSVSGGTAGTSIDQNGVLTVAKDESASVLTVTATVGSYTGTATVNVKQPEFTVYLQIGGPEGEVIELTVPRYGTLQKPQDPTRKGYVFGGWFIDEACTAEFDFTTPITGPLTLYALWNEAPAPSPDVPQTGDDGRVALWALLMLLSAAGSLLGVRRLQRGR